MPGFPALERRKAAMEALSEYLGFSADGNRTVALAGVEAVAPVPTADVAAIGADVGKRSDPSIGLHVRTTLAIEDWGEVWLPDRDSNPNSQNQNLLSYH